MERKYNRNEVKAHWADEEQDAGRAGMAGGIVAFLTEAIGKKPSGLSLRIAGGHRFRWVLQPYVTEDAGSAAAAHDEDLLVADYSPGNRWRSSRRVF